MGAPCSGRSWEISFDFAQVAHIIPSKMPARTGDGNLETVGDNNASSTAYKSEHSRPPGPPEASCLVRPNHVIDGRAMDKGAKIFVAGHTGLLGSALVKELARRGFRNVIAMPRRRLDLTNKESVFHFFATERPAYVFLAAGKVGGIIDNKTYPADYLHANLAIQVNLFEAAHRFGVEKLVFYGSSCMYPRECPQPMKEEHLLTGMVEQTSLGYAVAKIAGTIACRVYNQQYGHTRFIALVPNSMYGPNDNFDLHNCHVLSAMIRRFHDAKINRAAVVTLWGTGRVRREFIHSSDVAAASVFAVLNADKLENHHYNIGTGTDYSIEELASMVSEVVGYKGKLEWDTTKPDGAARKLLDSSKFQSLGWQPTVELRDGLRSTYQWYCAEGPAGQR